MPSRRVTARCTQCSNKNHLRARFCNECGIALKNRGGRNQGPSPSRLFVDIAHPINQHMRQLVHDSIMRAFHQEVERSDHRFEDDPSSDLDRQATPNDDRCHDRTLEADN